MSERQELQAYLMLLALKALPMRAIRQVAIAKDCLATLENPDKLPSALPAEKTLSSARRLVDRQLNWLDSNEAQALHISEAAYSTMLRESPDPPAWLFVQGNVAILQKPCLAVVGSREASKLSEELASSIGQSYSQAGGCIVSGLARGIDASAHRGALREIGSTAAVFGCGLDRLYPKQNAGLAKKIAQAGVCISEYPPMTSIRRHQFPERNRIIAGLCEGVVVVEAAMKSGSLITARLALEAGREVFAVPGNIWNNRYQGCHRLLKQGARLVQGLEDITEELPSFNRVNNGLKLPDFKSGQISQDHTPFEAALIVAMSYQTRSVADLAVTCNASVPETVATLTELEIKGIVVKQSANYRLALDKQSNRSG